MMKTVLKIGVVALTVLFPVGAKAQVMDLPAKVQMIFEKVQMAKTSGEMQSIMKAKEQVSDLRGKLGAIVAKLKSGNLSFDMFGVKLPKNLEGALKSGSVSSFKDSLKESLGTSKDMSVVEQDKVQAERKELFRAQLLDAHVKSIQMRQTLAEERKLLIRKMNQTEKSQNEVELISHLNENTLDMYKQRQIQRGLRAAYNNLELQQEIDTAEKQIPAMLRRK